MTAADLGPRVPVHVLRWLLWGALVGFIAGCGPSEPDPAIEALRSDPLFRVELAGATADELWIRGLGAKTQSNFQHQASLDWSGGTFEDRLTYLRDLRNVGAVFDWLACDPDFSEDFILRGDRPVDGLPAVQSVHLTADASSKRFELRITSRHLPDVGRSSAVDVQGPCSDQILEASGLVAR